MPSYWPYFMVGFPDRHSGRRGLSFSGSRHLWTSDGKRGDGGRRYKVIGDDYKSSIDSSNVVVSENNIAFANALFELGNKKHETSKMELMKINENIT